MASGKVIEEKLFGHPKWEVESLADSITRVNEAKSTKPDLYEASIKLLRRRQTALSAVLKAAIKR